MAKCKECGGNNAKKLSIIEKMGTQSGVARGSGVGVTGDGVGVGFTHANINTKSDLARESAFRSSTNIEYGFVGKLTPWIAGIVAIIMWSNEAIFGGIVVGFIILFVGYFIDSFTESGQAASDKWLKEYRKEKDNYAKTWMCLDCGYKWIGKK